MLEELAAEISAKQLNYELIIDIAQNGLVATLEHLQARHT